MKIYLHVIFIFLILIIYSTQHVNAEQINFHTFIIKDQQGNPIEEAVVNAKKISKRGIIYNNETLPSCITDKNGQCQFSQISIFDSRYINLYSTVEAEVLKKGYFPSIPYYTHGDSRSNNGLSIVLESSKKILLARFKTVDLKGMSLSGVKIIGKIERYNATFDCITDLAGTCEKNVKYEAVDYEEPDFNAEASITGRYTQTFTKVAKFDQSDIEFNFTLDEPSDYLCDLINVPSSHALAAQMSGWVNILRLKAIIQDTVFLHGDFCMESFKQKKYSSINLSNTTVFNSLKNNSYQIGIIVFDDIVRKMLDVVAPAVATFPLDGYEIRVKTATGDASENYVNKKILDYQFFLPKNAVKSYKNKDITGQQLINSSVILLNDERIDLKLQ